MSTRRSVRRAVAADVASQDSEGPAVKAEPAADLEVSESGKRRKADLASPAAATPSQPEPSPGIPAEGGKKKPKRSFANAYTRKGEGFTALVESLQGRSKPVEEAHAVLRKEGVAVKREDPDPHNEGQPTTPEAPKAKQRRKQQPPDPNAPTPFVLPPEDVLAEAMRQTPRARPVPNLGFACLNATLRAQKPPIFSNRDCIKRTWEAKGVAWVSALSLENCKALPQLIFWNHLHGIRFFRMSSKIFPWCTEYEVAQLPHYSEIADTLAFAGRLARALDQRLTFHPSHFVKLGCEPGPLLDRSLKELEVHSQIFDLMGYPPSPENKINIHIGGVYGDKEATLERFARNFQRLSPACQRRLTVENDDMPNAFSITDLLTLHEKTGIPLVFDFHHHRFCPGGLTEEAAFKAALATWPEGVRPVVHWSESQEGRRPSAHSDFVKGPLRLYGLDDKVDVMIEAKGKELALLCLRDPNFKPHAAALATLKDE